MATLDVLTTNEAYQTLRLMTSDNTNTTLCAAAVTTISLQLDDLCGPIVRRTHTDALDGGCDQIRVPHWPITSVSAITEYSGGTGTTLTAETNGTAGTYRLEPYSQPSAPYSGRIFRRSGFSAHPFAAGWQNVSVTYSAGRFESTTNVSERFKGAARICLENAWQQFREGVGSVGEFDVPITSFPRFGVPTAARDMLGGEVQVEFDTQGHPHRVQVA